MKRKKIDLEQERKIITLMIAHTEFLKRIYPIAKSNYFKSPYAKIVSQWVIDYFIEFKEAPEKYIQEIYYKNFKYINNEEEVEIVKDFLLSLSKDWEKLTKLQNLEFLIKNSVEYLKLRSLTLLKEKLEFSIENNDILKAENEIVNYSKVEENKSQKVSILKDSSLVSAAFLDEDEILFSFPGVLGEVSGPFLRGDLSAILAFAKRGKTWWQWYIGQLAVYYGFSACFLSLEMTQNQLVRRGWQSFVAQPRYSKEIEIPYFKEIDGEEEKFKWEVLFKNEFRNGIDVEEIPKLQKKFTRQFRSGSMEIITLPAFSATIEDINMRLDNLYYYDNFIPDIIIIDYADIILPSKGRNEYRHQLDDIWKKLRKMAQERNVSVVTASQAGRASANKDATEEDIVEDIRKIGHVGKLLVINQDNDDRKINACRISQLAERDGKRNYRDALILQCLDIGRPYIDSRYNDEVER